MSDNGKYLHEERPTVYDGFAVYELPGKRHDLMIVGMYRGMKFKGAPCHNSPDNLRRLIEIGRHFVRGANHEAMPRSPKQILLIEE